MFHSRGAEAFTSFAAALRTFFELVVMSPGLELPSEARGLYVPYLVLSYAVMAPLTAAVVCSRVQRMHAETRSAAELERETGTQRVFELLAEDVDVPRVSKRRVAGLLSTCAQSEHFAAWENTEDVVFSVLDADGTRAYIFSKNLLIFHAFSQAY